MELDSLVSGLHRLVTLIDKIPGGRKLGVRGRVRSAGPREARLERAAEKAIDMALKELTVPLDKPVEQMSDGELFSSNFRESLLFNRSILRHPINLNDPNPEILRAKREISLSTQLAAIRLRTELVPRSDDSVVNRLMQRVAALRRGELLELEPEAKTVEPTG